MKRVLITGVAGFIGSNVAKSLLNDGYYVVGVDTINDYYSIELKLTRLNLITSSNFRFIKADISDIDVMNSIFEEHDFDYVINLAAQAGVRYSIENPDSYMKNNVNGFYNIIELCRKYPIKHLLYASSSSVYGANTKVPFSETDNVDNPVSLYAATKKTNELMASCYSHLYKIPSTGLRFFTVYGEFGRPDMAYFGFVDKFFNNEPIKIFNNGDFENDLYRDFTYIDDIVTGIVKLMDVPPTDARPHKVYNIGNSTPVKLMEFIETLELCLSNSLSERVEFKKIFEEIKPGDVPATYADTTALESVIDFRPSTSVEEGLQRFTDWYVEYFEKI